MNPHLELYTYLGDGTVVVRSNPASTLTLESAGTSDSGDHYTGLDRFGRVIDQKWVSTSDPSQVTDDFAYTYDADSNVKTRVDNVSGAPASEAYDYDNLNRLSSATGGLYGSQSWTLDAVGNLSGFNNDGTSDSRTFNTLNELTGGTVNGVNSTVVYDADGNTTTDQHGYTMVYDAWNRLVKVEDTAANDHALLETYSYDGLGHRVLQTITPAGATAGAAAGAVAGTTAYYYSSQWQVLEERVDGATAANIQNVWSPVYVNALVCQDSLALGQSGVLGNPGTGQAQRLFIQQDANYNVTAVLALQTLPGDTNLDGTVNFTDYSTLIQHWQETVTGGAGVGDFNYDGKVDFNDYSILVQNWQATASLTWQVVQRVAYDPDGKQTVLTGNWSATPYPAFVLQGFQGGLKDQITGNINFDFRDYNPATMTWNTQDPLGFVDGVNWYEPEGGNPIQHLDSTGLLLRFATYHIGKDFGPSPYTSSANKYGPLYHTKDINTLSVDERAQLDNIVTRAYRNVFVGPFAGAPNAADFLDHFLSNTGTTKIVDFSKIVREDPNAQEAAIDDLMQATAFAVNHRNEIRDSPSRTIVSDWITHQLINGDWYHSIGHFAMASRGSHIICDIDGNMSMTWLAVLSKFYKWDPGSPAPGGFVTDGEMAELHAYGLAKEFWVFGYMSTTVTWNYNYSAGGMRWRAVHALQDAKKAWDGII